MSLQHSYIFDDFEASSNGSLGLPQEREVRMNADHAGIARFRDTMDSSFYSVREVLLGLISDVHEERE